VSLQSILKQSPQPQGRRDQGGHGSFRLYLRLSYVGATRPGPYNARMHFFALKQDTARTLLVALVLVLFFGTLMPGHWKEAGTRPFASVLDLAAASHVVLFALISFLVPRAQFWAVRPWHVFALGAALALATEGLQFFAVDRHPNLAGLCWDLIGTVIGWSVGRMVAASRLQRVRGARANPAGRSTVRSRRR
jgi:hypothetical protein